MKRRATTKPDCSGGKPDRQRDHRQVQGVALKTRNVDRRGRKVNQGKSREERQRHHHNDRQGYGPGRIGGDRAQDQNCDDSHGERSKSAADGPDPADPCQLRCRDTQVGDVNTSWGVKQ